MKKYADFIEEFLSFCKEQDISKASAKSYVSYLNGAVKHFSWPLISLKEKIEKDEKGDLLKDFSDLLVKVDEQRGLPVRAMPVSGKTLSNYHSAIVTFLSYLEYAALKTKKRPLPSGKKVVLSQKELIRTFRARITTQGRVYEDYVIPFRTYNRILHNNQAYKKGLQAYIQSIYFIVTDSAKTLSTVQEKVPLREVKSIEFQSNRTLLSLKNGGEKLVLTEVFNRNVRGASYELLIGQITDCSLDHKNPLYSLRATIDGKPQMKKLSDGALDYLKKNPSMKKLELDRTFSTLDFSGTDATLGVQAEKLCEELFDFLAQTELVIMDKRYNSSKNSEV